MSFRKQSSPCFIRSHPCLFTFLFHFFTVHFPYFFLRTGGSTAIRTLVDSLADLPNKVPSQVVCSYHPVEVTLVLLPSRRKSLESIQNSGEDIATTRASSEVDERQSMGMLAAPLFVTPSFQYRENCCDVLAQAKIEARSKTFTGV